MFQLNNNDLPIDVPFSHEGTSYPANWLRLASPEERSALGITEVADPASFDDRFYLNANTPRDLSVLKVNHLAETKSTTHKMLAETDWMFIRKIERNIDIPDSILAYRAAVLVECDKLLTAIEAATTVDELASIPVGWPAKP
jgi:hypothetical protein